MGKQFYIITLQGSDKPGLVAGVSEILADSNVNILDIDQTVIRKLFSMFMIVDFINSTKTFEDVKEKLTEKAGELNMKISIEPYLVEEETRDEKKLILLTIIGKDRPGIVSKFSKICSDNNVNFINADVLVIDTLSIDQLFIFLIGFCVIDGGHFKLVSVLIDAPLKSSSASFNPLNESIII